MKHRRKQKDKVVKSKLWRDDKSFIAKQKEELDDAFEPEANPEEPRDAHRFFSSEDDNPTIYKL